MRLSNVPVVYRVGLVLALLLPMYAAAQPSLTLPPHPPAALLSAAEYYFDNDPGYGNGMPLALTPDFDLTLTRNIDISQLSRGPHRLYVRSKGGNGQWSHSASQVFTTYSYLEALPAATIARDIIAAEYFIDTDPGAGNGTPITVTPGADISAGNITVGTGGLSSGVHYLFVRAKDAGGCWSQTANARFSFVINTLNNLPVYQPGKPISRLEYFIDTDPGFGQGSQLTVPETTDLSNYTFAADITNLAAGPHTFFVRTVNGASMTVAQAFQLGSTNPLPVKWISLSAQLQGDTAVLDWRTGTEKNVEQYVVERSTDGRDFRPIGALDGGDEAEDEHSYRFKDGGIRSGTTYYRIGLHELDGKRSWSPVVSVRKDAMPAGVRINNPVMQTLDITWREQPSLNSELTVLNAIGNPVLRLRCDGNQEQHIDLGSLPPGIYLLRCATSDGIHTLKFAKQ